MKNIILMIVWFLSSLSVLAQTTYDYDYDNAGNRIRLNSGIACGYSDCKCPEEADKWLNIITTPGTIGCPNACEVTNSFNLPIEYSCYTHFDLQISGYKQTRVQFKYNGQTQLPGINTCLPKGQTMNIKLLLKRGIDDPEPCKIEKVVGCDFNCCDYLKVMFIPSEPTQPGECCWEIHAYSENELLCGLSNVSFRLFKDGEEITSIDKDKFCLPEHGVLDYVILINGVECETRSVNLKCNSCDCPDESIKSKWISLFVEKNNPVCQTGQCAVSAKLNIPTEYQSCYSYYSLAYKIVNYDGTTLVDQPYSNIGQIQSNVNLNGLPSCINPGEKIQVAVRLYKNSNDNDFCELASSQVFCERFDFGSVNPCTPSYLPQDPWPTTNNGKARVRVGDCEYWVSYRYRSSSDDHRDIEITGIEECDPTCSNIVSIDEIMKATLPIAIGQILIDQRAWQPQGNGCSEVWRVIQNTCWSKWMYNGQSMPPYNIYQPCISGCCVRKLQVCKKDNIVTVIDLGYIAGVNGVNCNSAILPGTNGMSADLEGCKHIGCGILNKYKEETPIPDRERLQSFYDIPPVLIRPKEADENIYSQVSVSKDMMYNISFTNDKIIINFKSKEIKNISIEVYDLIGNHLLNHEQQINNSESKIELDIKELNTGTYIINITNGNISIGRDKFVIIR